MTSRSPVPPAKLCPYARDVLEHLAGHPAASAIVLGGGVALAHYLEYRDTFDLDAWWANGPTKAANALLDDAMRAVARKHGLSLAQRTWGDTMSLELLDGQRKVFSLQIASRDRYLDTPIDAAWLPLRIETLRDNVASKMTALVERGAPRDLRDVYELCRSGLVSVDECWGLYREKHPEKTVADGAAKVLHSVERLDMQRPLDTIQSETDRRSADAVRKWFREVFCRHSS